LVGKLSISKVSSKYFFIQPTFGSAINFTMSPGFTDNLQIIFVIKKVALLSVPLDLYLSLEARTRRAYVENEPHRVCLFANIFDSCGMLY